MDHKTFIEKRKALAIAPAGHGKTHAITDCMTQILGRQLILTHTHAGVASLRDKLKKQNISSKAYNLETITSYAQAIVQNFYTGKDIPPPESGKTYYAFLIEKATSLLNKKPIKDVIAATYKGLFVDEYQDCTISQHTFIMKLSDILSTRIFGDPLQGIFGFSEALVDLNDKEQMGDFLEDRITLSTPYRWRGVNENLGETLKSIRVELESTDSVDLSKYRLGMELIIAPEADLYNGQRDYHKKIISLLNDESILIIDPDSTSVTPRIKKISSFQNRIRLIESIDDKSFYDIAKKIDLISTEDSPSKKIRDLIAELLSPDSIINQWFDSNGLKSFKKEEKRQAIQKVKESLDDFSQSRDISKIPLILKGVEKLPNIKSYRKELFKVICSAIYFAKENNVTVYEAVVVIRNKTRRAGRKVIGRCIGTTLLTKGLEFDTVVVLNAQKFDKKNFYVALTRARKKLVVFANQNVLSF